jgi:hypothetical protein
LKKNNPANSAAKTCALEIAAGNVQNCLEGVMLSLLSPEEGRWSNLKYVLSWGAVEQRVHHRALDVSLVRTRHPSGYPEG